MAEKITVFISSTSKDLKEFREAVKGAVLRRGFHPITMEDFNPTEQNALQLCYDKVQEADIFLGIYAHRYGYAPTTALAYTTSNNETRTGDDTTSITHMEYHWAVERKLPMRLFVLSDTGANGQTLTWPIEHIEDEPGKSRL